MLPVTRIIASLRSSRPSLGSNLNARERDWLLRPALQRGAPRFGQTIGATLNAVEPAVDIVQQNFRRVRNSRLEFTHLARALRQGRCTSKRPLAVGRHD